MTTKQTTKACEKSPTGEHAYAMDLEYDPTGWTVTCEHCGADEPKVEGEQRAHFAASNDSSDSSDTSSAPAAVQNIEQQTEQVFEVATPENWKATSVIKASKPNFFFSGKQHDAVKPKAEGEQCTPFAAASDNSIDFSSDTSLAPIAAQSVDTSAPAPTSVLPFLTQQLAQLPATPPSNPLTNEQQAIVETAPTVQVLVIEAGAGAGKTFTLRELANTLPGRGQYTAFNTALVAESKAKFGSACQCNTIHSLAFRSEGHKFSHRLNRRARTRSSELAAMLGIEHVTVHGLDGKDKILDAGTLATMVVKAVKTFCQSADREVTAKHFGRMVGLDASDSHTNEDMLKAYLTPFAAKMWKDVSSPTGQLPFTHDYYVKVWQLNKPVIHADYVLLDEAQDTSPVMLDVLQQQVQAGLRVIVVGDSAQQIYQWRGACNALAAFSDAPRLYLSQSFRFGPAVASVANAVLAHLRDRSKLVMRGLESIPTKLVSLQQPRAILCRTNAGAIGHLLSSLSVGHKAHMVGGGTDALAFVEAATDLQRGRRTSHPELCLFGTWGEVEVFAKTEEGEDLRLMCKLVKDFGADKIATALKSMPEERDADVVISTAHRSKGREWDTVKLASDFKTLDKSGDEELRLLYVAATRAKLVLDLETCPPFAESFRLENDDDEMERPGSRCIRRVPTINIDEARRLSKSVESNQMWKEEGIDNTCNGRARSEKDIKEVAKIIDSKPTGTPVKNIWSKRDGRWLVRGKPGQSGLVEVERRNGSTSKKTISKVVWQDDEVALYEVER